jgi:two-component system sensor histidine kinase ArlS
MFKLNKFKKISLKLTIIYASIFLFIIILLNASVLYGINLFLNQQASSKISHITKTVTARIIGNNNETMNLNDPELISEGLTDTTINIKIADQALKIVNDSNNFNTDTIDTQSFINKFRKIKINDMLIVYYNSKIAANPNAPVYLQVAINMEKESNFIHILIFLMICAVFIGVIISLLAGYFMSRKMLMPIDKITKTAQNINIHDLYSHIEVDKTDDEISRLAKTFNEMIDRLRNAFEKQNQFVSDASHELRTPISVIGGNINLIDRWGKDDKTILQDSIDAIKKETSDMTVLIEKLLFLANSDSGTYQLNNSYFLLNDLIDEVVKECQIISQVHKFNADKNDKIIINADKGLIKQMLRAILDNSIKFTPSNGQISIQSKVINNFVEIIIKDTGSGIETKDLSKIFDRFYRIDKARSKVTGGSGLGFSIVKWIVETHDGKIVAKSKVGEGTSIIITLPINI